MQKSNLRLIENQISANLPQANYTPFKKVWNDLICRRAHFIEIIKAKNWFAVLRLFEEFS